VKTSGLWFAVEICWAVRDDDRRKKANVESKILLTGPSIITPQMG
jgi:hypothetical protein